VCGIAAVLSVREGVVPTGTVRSMMHDVAHRGPDGERFRYLQRRASGWSAVEDEGRWTVGLGHRRLSILDLSESAFQPMQRADLWIVFNGEIFNYVELRDELEREGVRFATHSDTEVLLAVYQRHGPQGFEKLRGMWGLVLVDTARNELIACRDRLGIKPLYVDATEQRVAFVSELKQLLRVRSRLEIDESVLKSYLASGYEEQGKTFFKEPRPLKPGTWERWSLDGRLLETSSYWSPEQVTQTIASPDEAAQALRAELTRSVKEHLRSDVPVGCALSGGLDSSAVAALVRGQNPLSLETFTATFPGDEIDERRWADKVAAHVRGTPHWVQPAAERLADELDRFVWIHDEPVGHVSQYSGWCVARLTREAGVPVTLNGQGGDEVLSGYWQSYMMHLYGLRRPTQLPRLALQLVRTAASGNRELLVQLPVMARRYLSRRMAARGTSAADALAGVLSMSEPQRRIHEICVQYLPRLLKWDDRNFMAFGVEGRYPFLDHRVIELCLSMKTSALYSKGWLKEPLRRAMLSVLPDDVVRRRDKKGFEAPQNAWLRGPLKPLLDRISDGDPVWGYTDRAAGHTLLNAASWSEEDGQKLFRLLMAQRWLAVFDRPATATQPVRSTG
jgi:asparagine synthase (glutamine-hydrolysing)